MFGWYYCFIKGGSHSKEGHANVLALSIELTPLLRPAGMK